MGSMPSYLRKEILIKNDQGASSVVRTYTLDFHNYRDTLISGLTLGCTRFLLSCFRYATIQTKLHAVQALMGNTFCHTNHYKIHGR